MRALLWVGFLVMGVAQAAMADGEMPTKDIGSGLRLPVWRETTDISALDGTKNYTAAAESVIQYKSDGTLENPNTWGGTLILRCSAGKLSAYINWAPYIGGDRTNVTWRLDDGKIWNQTWDISSDGMATFSPTPLDFMADLEKSRKLVVEITPYRKVTGNSVFDVRGADVIVPRIKSACGK